MCFSLPCGEGGAQKSFSHLQGGTAGSDHEAALPASSMGAPWEKKEQAQSERFAEPHVVGRIWQPAGEGLAFIGPLVLKLSTFHCVHRTQQMSTQVHAKHFRPHPSIEFS